LTDINRTVTEIEETGNAIDPLETTTTTPALLEIPETLEILEMGAMRETLEMQENEMTEEEHRRPRLPILTATFQDRSPTRHLSR
jgi:hypothetical protein